MRRRMRKATDNEMRWEYVRPGWRQSSAEGLAEAREKGHTDVVALLESIVTS